MYNLSLNRIFARNHLKQILDEQKNHQLTIDVIVAWSKYLGNFFKNRLKLVKIKSK